MSTESDKGPCDRVEQVSAYALRALPVNEASFMKAHIRECPHCQQELQALQPTIDSFADWPGELLRPSPSIWDRLVQRITDAPRGGETPFVRDWSEPDWEEVAPGISCKLFATNAANDRVTMLVRLGPGVAYPPHRHAGIEELYLLHGELWIEGRKLQPGDYNRAEPHTADRRVWSETGCTCVLITSPSDVLS